MNADADIHSLQKKIDELNHEAWNIRVNNSTKAHMLSKEAVELSEKIDYAKGKAEGYRIIGFSYIRLSQHEQALIYLRKSLQLFDALNDLQGQAPIYGYFGIIERSLGNYKSSLDHLFKALELTQQYKDFEEESLGRYHIGVTYKYLGNYELALEHLLQSLAIARDIDCWMAKSYSINVIGQVYFETGDYTRALSYYNESLIIRRKSGDKWGEAGCLDNIGFTHFKLNNYEDSRKFCTEGLLISEAIGDKKGEGNALLHLGLIHQQLNNLDRAVECGNRSLQIRSGIGDKKGEAEVLLFLAELHLKMQHDEQQFDQSFELLNKAMQFGEETQAVDLMANIHYGFYEVCKQKSKYEEALSHLEAYIKLTKQIHTEAVNKKIQNLEISHSVEKSRQEAEIYRLRNIELAELYEESKRQKDEIEVQKKNVEDAFIELKETQRQLVQREKMASLGELTAGIAHEIQNPLNFVNNFSEVNIELVVEMKEELAIGNKQQATELANDLEQNLAKIQHHGKRADAIVKGMLQHSRVSSGKKEPADINVLADEYLRLSYHGLRAKNNSFTASIKTEFDDRIQKIDVVPQDIGRVLLNLYNNAFYAVSLPIAIGTKGGFKNSPIKYEPTVTVTTSLNTTRVGRETIMISVKDNGPGIPQNIVDKIFQPFFTTKPAGEGTGLGLSLSYDIIKAHGGEMKVETKEGEGAEFIIYLPITS